MRITTILFDLDGTLLPMDQETFAKAYIGGLAKAAEPYGYEPMTMTSSILAGTAAMIKNNGEKSNEAVFWDVLVKTYGEELRKNMNMFDEFYRTDFQKIKDVCGFAPQASKVVAKIKEGKKLVSPIRDNVWLAQTPQVFMTEMYRAAAYSAIKNNTSVTDDASLCEALGFEVHPVDCTSQNIKITTPYDFAIAEAILKFRENEESK